MNPSRDVVAKPCPDAPSGRRRWTCVYDAAGQVLASVDPLLNRTTFAYNGAGMQVTVMDATGKVTTNVYATTSNRLAATVDALGNYTSFTYDLAGQQTAIQDARGNRTTFAYDAAGRVVTQINAVGNRTTYNYDVRHEATRWIVLRGRTRQDRVSHHSYPTRKIESPPTTYPALV